MTFVAGQRGGPGRPPGSPNKNNEVRAYLSKHNVEAIGLFLKEWDQVRKTDSLEAARLMLQFLEYVYPKQKNIEVQMTEEQAVIVLQSAIEHAGNDIPITTQSLPITSGE